MGEVNYRIHSFSMLLRDAEGYLEKVSAVNSPWRKREDMLSPSSRSCVEAEPGRLSFNFASQVVRSMVVREMPAIENILSEGSRQMVLSEKCAVMCAETLMTLGMETRRFLDGMTGTAPLDANDSMALALENTRPYFRP